MSKPTSPPLPVLLLTVAEAGTILHRGKTTMYELLNSGELPSTKVGGSRRIRLADVEAYVANLPIIPVGADEDLAA